MSRSYPDRLRDAREHAESALTLARGHSAVSLMTDTDRRDAVLFRIVIVGEAVGQVPDAIRSLEPRIPWRNIVDTRNRLVHAYWQIDLLILVDLIANDLEPLITGLDRLIAMLPGEKEP